MPELYGYLHDKMKAETLEERLLFLLIIPREFVTAILLLNYTCSRVLSIHRVDDLRRIVSSGNFHYNRNEPGMAPIADFIAETIITWLHLRHSLWTSRRVYSASNIKFARCTILSLS